MTKTGRSERTRRPQTCALCRHPARMEIEIAKIRGASLGALAKQHGLSGDSIWRHMKNHCSAKRRAELAGGVAADQLVAVAERESRTLVEYLSIIRSGLLDLFTVARGVGDAGNASMLSGRLHENLKILANLSGELRAASGISIVNNNLTLMATPGFAELHQGLLAIVRKHPEAREDIVELLRSLDATSHAPGPNGSRYIAEPVDPVMIECEPVEAELEGASVE
jgi:hypothetical protein